MPGLRPPAEAIKLTRLWQAARGDTYPIRADELAIEWSRQVSPDDPIGEVRSEELPGFEGGLFWLKNRREWVVLYRPHETARGRANFTIAHEFGHYVLHRKRQTTFQCSQNDALGVGAEIEREADEFASYLLMPINDFRDQVASKPVTLDLMGACAERYQVSLTAAVLKWLSFTEQPAILVTGRDGMVLWWRASDSARRAAFANIRIGMELPAASLAVSPTGAASQDLRLGVDRGRDIWLRGVEVREMAILSDRYDMTISLLVFAAAGPLHEDEPDDDLTTRSPTFGRS
jgi:hypothetical protein